MVELPASERAKGIEYAIRDVAVPAAELERQGHRILKLNIGDPVAYDFDTPEHIKDAFIGAINDGKNGYSPSYGIPSLIEAIVSKERSQDCDVSTDDIIVGTGVTELLQMLFASMLSPGDEVLIPGPSYPPYTSYVKFFDGTPVPYRTDEENGWQPDLDDMRSKVTDRTKAICIINPNNPTGALYEESTLRAIMDLAGEHGIPVISDEIYDRMTYERPAVPTARTGSDVPLVVLNGISKVYIAPGWRVGYAAFRDPSGALDDVKDGVQRQARARLCPSHPAQVAFRAALEGPQDHIAGTNRTLKERRDIALKRIGEIEELSSTTPGGAFYMFPKIEAPDLQDDKAFVLDLLHKKHVLFVHGSGFCCTYGKGHFRMVHLPPVELINEAFDRVEEYFRGR